MVHQHSGPAVPEELYNLTQLADVTLAAGKLRTDAVAVDALGRIGSMSAFTPVRQGQQLVPTSSSYNSCQLPGASSSDDDTDSTAYMRNYAHKIFDRRKARHHPVNATTTNTVTITPTPPTICVNDAQRQWCDRERVSGAHPSPVIAFQQKPTARLEVMFKSNAMGVHAIENDQPGEDTDDDMGGLVMDDECLGDGGAEDEHCDDDGEQVAEGDESDIHVCPECGKKYSTSSNLARHRQTHRSLMDKKARRCPHCDKVYVSMPAFSMHVRTHNQGCECPHCGKRFSRPWLLQGHIRTHTGEKPFECSICNKAFADKSNLRAHIQTHSNTKPHTCTRCGKSFALKSYLYKHEESSCVRNLNKSSSSPSSVSSSTTTSPTTDKSKAPRRSNSSASSASSSSSTTFTVTPLAVASKSVDSTAVTSLAKSLKRGKTNTTTTSTELQRKCREKLRDKLRGPAAVAADKIKREQEDSVQANAVSQLHRVTTDSGSQKSYIDLSPSPSTPLNSEPYSRISVIRSAMSSGNAVNASEPSAEQRTTSDNQLQSPSHMAMGFYQEMPMDFSPKASSANFTANAGSTFGVASKYAVIA